MRIELDSRFRNRAGVVLAADDRLSAPFEFVEHIFANIGYPESDGP